MLGGLHIGYKPLIPKEGIEVLWQQVQSSNRNKRRRYQPPRSARSARNIRIHRLIGDNRSLQRRQSRATAQTTKRRTDAA